MQCVAVCYSMLQGFLFAHDDVLQRVAMCCSVLQCVAAFLALVCRRLNLKSNFLSIAIGI